MNRIPSVLRSVAARRFPLPPLPAGGFTLVEIMVTVAISGALIGLGTPSMRSLLARHAAANQANELLDALRLARSEAMKRGGPVILCKTDPASAALCSTDERVNWQTWMVFADANRSGVYEPGDTIVRSQVVAPSHLLVTSELMLSSVRFEATGIARPGTGTSGVAFSLGPVPSSTGASNTAEAGRNAWRLVCLNARGDSTVIGGGEACP
jgi:type IV fimbrial biogenesis protein FimT